MSDIIPLVPNGQPSYAAVTAQGTASPPHFPANPASPLDGTSEAMDIETENVPNRDIDAPTGDINSVITSGNNQVRPTSAAPAANPNKRSAKELDAEPTPPNGSTSHIVKKSKTTKGLSATSGKRSAGS
ncbi:hypothetical protein M422DRAFT_50608 [Sphaerobolus stellatus SS14]|uniref:Unplaced genomic scaffold SPHSTscaffold_96, whole genome shotgun sequence n=1 Tax=Sphaerobolus stellatus (strain SS14) TaxID=990650 RepID=A0A0C9V6B6_SPHS4|nr:hypothetical protein M422DRAFT_50608 [Sphaerobolus stellatus SS14]